jgi:hypothetical protein
METKNLRRQILIHAIGSIVFLSFPILFSPDLSSNVLNINPVRRDLIQYVLLLLFFYLSYFVLVPRLYFNKKFVAFTLSLLGCYLLISLLPEYLIPHQHHHPPAQGGGHFPPPPHRSNFPLFHEIGRNIFKFLLILFFSVLLRIYHRWKQTEKEKLDAELSYLKAQINPHFLFNSLNSIYSLALQEGGNQTASAIEKLSGMMRYVLSEAHQEKVSLEKELNYIESYIELQRVRFGNTIQLNYNVSGAVSHYQIAPLILISFIENAFKHGINPEENSEINTSIEIHDGELTLQVYNKKVETVNKLEEKSGLGIDNTKFRLQLLYPGKHRLLITETDINYKVFLNIVLND